MNNHHKIGGGGGGGVIEDEREHEREHERELKLEHYLLMKWGTQDPKKIVDEISKGKYYPTHAFLVATTTTDNHHHHHHDHDEYQLKIIQAGGLNTVLELLLQSDQEFKKVVVPISTSTSSTTTTTSVSPSASEEDTLLVTSPSIWVQIISCFSKDGCLVESLDSNALSSSSSSSVLQLQKVQQEIQYKIVNNISGLFQDMANLERRTVFGSQVYWIESLPYFTALLSNLLCSTNVSTGFFLIKQPMVKQFLIQIIYLDYLFVDANDDHDDNAGNDPTSTIRSSTSTSRIVQDIDNYTRTKTTNNDDNDIIGYSQSYCAVAIKTITENAEKSMLATYQKNQNQKRSTSTSSAPTMNQRYALLGEFAVTMIHTTTTATTNDSSGNHNNDIELVPLRFGTGMIQLLEGRRRQHHPRHRHGFYSQGGYASMLSLFLKLYDWGGRISGKFVTIHTNTDTNSNTNTNIDCVSSHLVPICSHQLLLYSSKRRDQHHFYENVVTSLVVLRASFMTPLIRNRNKVDNTKKLGQQQQYRQAPIDYNIAKAIYHGLLEYCLDICDCNDGRLSTYLERLLQPIVLLLTKGQQQKSKSSSPHPKLTSESESDTQQAIRLQEKELRAKVARVQDRPPYLVSCLTLIQQLIDIAAPVPVEDSSSSTCELCSKHIGSSTTHDMIHKCPFCKLVTYCSLNCLQVNWSVHQQSTSCLLLRGQTTTNTITNTKSILIEEGKQIFLDHLYQILLQASLKGFSILYCIVIIDMIEATPLLRTLTYEQFIHSYHTTMYRNSSMSNTDDTDNTTNNNDFLSKSKETFERNKMDGSVTVAMVGFSTPTSEESGGLSVSLLTFPPDTIPVHQLSGSSSSSSSSSSIAVAAIIQNVVETEKWTTTQKEVAGKSLQAGGDGWKKLQSNPQRWRASIVQTMKP